MVVSTVPEAEDGTATTSRSIASDTHVGITAFTNHATVGIGVDALGSDDRDWLEAMGDDTGTEPVQIGYEQDVPTAELIDLLVAKTEAAGNAEWVGCCPTSSVTSTYSRREGH